MQLARAASIEDLRLLARRRLPSFAFTYLDEGAGDDGGLRHSRSAFDGLKFKVRRLQGSVSGAEVEVFGERYSVPFGSAPIGLANLAWPGADLAVASLAEANGFPYVLSTAATTSIEDVVRVAPTMTWFQYYPSREPAISEGLVARAEEAGIRVLVLTIDVPTSPRRNRSIRGAVTVPFRFTPRVVADLALHPRWAFATLSHGSPRLANYGPYLQSAAVNHAGRMMAQLNRHWLTWNDVEQVRERWKGKLVLKGILGEEDAARAVSLGANGIWVSNHGGRQLESSPATIDVLGPIRDTVPTHLPVFMDSGVRTGEDVVKACALGATMVFCGRAFIYGAGAGGAAGAARAFELLKAEVLCTLGQIGAPSLSALDRSFVIPAASGRQA